jgi:hypothetical protein
VNLLGEERLNKQAIDISDGCLYEIELIALRIVQVTLVDRRRAVQLSVVLIIRDQQCL